MKSLLGLGFVALGGLGLIALSPAKAANPAVCPGLKGQARTACLEDENRRTNAIARRDSRRARILESAHKGGCTAEGYGRATTAAAGATFGVGGAVGSVAAYDGGRYIGKKVAGESGCR